jgi:mono/diheme cytochrome c family protein
MKSICLIAIVAVLAAVPLSLWSEETGASLYKGKTCSACHGDKGEGNPGVAPALKGTKLTSEKIVTFLTKGEKGKGFHETAISDLTAAQAKLIADFIKTLK